VTIDRTNRRTTKRRRIVKPSRGRATEATTQGRDKKKIALLTRKLNETVAQQKAAYERETATSRELSEALEREAATAQVLNIISSSPIDLEPVFEAMLANATRLCEASHGTLWLCEGDAFRIGARHGALPAAFVERRGSLFRPGTGVPFARAARTRQAVHVTDFRA